MKEEGEKREFLKDLEEEEAEEEEEEEARRSRKGLGFWS